MFPPIPVYCGCFTFAGMDLKANPSATRKANAPRRRLRTIVADDSPEFLRSFCTFLRSQADFDLIGQASDGSEAVTLAGVLQPDLAVLDLEMPDMNGLRAAELLRARFPALRIVMISVHSNFVGRESNGNAVVDAFISKSELIQNWPREMDRLFGTLATDGGGK